MPVTGAFIVPHPPIIMPQVGRGEEKKISRTFGSYEEAARRVAALKPDTIVLASPHSIMYSDYFHISPGMSAKGDLRKFGAPEVSVSVRYDTWFVSELEKAAESEGIPAGTLGERDGSLDHGTVIPLAFVNSFYSGYSLVRIGLSGLSLADHYRLGMCVAEVAGRSGKNVVFIASGDLSHKVSANGPYGFAPEGPEFDRQITEAMASGDFLRFLSFPPDFTEKAAECGLRSCVIMAGALDGKKVEAELLSYEGTFGVGYGIASFLPVGDDEDRRFLKMYLEREHKRIEQIKNNEDEYVKLARHCVEHFVKTGKRAQIPSGLPEEMLKSRAGVFVSIKKYGELRGCIGTISPVTGSIAEEICRNAVSSCSEDPRFMPVRPEELPDLQYSVDVLSPPESISSPEMLDVRRYGVIVSCGARKGLLLPNLDGVDTVEQQIEIAMRKGGIRPGENYRLQRFEVVRHQ